MGTLPAEAMIHQRFLTFFGNIARLPDTSVERQLALRQLSVKSMSSSSWYNAIKKLCILYDLPECTEILHNTPTKAKWRSTVHKAVKKYWSDRIQAVVPLYPILTHLAYIANGKKRVILCNNFTGRISVTLLCGICDVSYPTKQR